MDAQIQLGQALQGGQLVLRLLSGCGPATAHHTAGVHPAGALAAASLGLWTTRRSVGATSAGPHAFTLSWSAGRSRD